jgi:hypothetical protein
MVSRNKRLQRKRRKAQKRCARQAKSHSTRPNTCGECRACCYVFALPGKPEKCWCKHSMPEGCDCYMDRPSVCRGYRCGYLQLKIARATWRPDKSGIVISCRGRFRGHSVVRLSECWDNAIDGELGREILATLLANNVIVRCITRVGDGVRLDADTAPELDANERVELVLCNANTVSVLDAGGRAELDRQMAEYVEYVAQETEKEPFDFGSGASTSEESPDPDDYCTMMVHKSGDDLSANPDVPTVPDTPDLTPPQFHLILPENGSPVDSVGRCVDED